MDIPDIVVEAKQVTEKVRGSWVANIVGLIAVLTALSVVALVGYRMFFLTWVENYEQAYAFYTWGGKIELINRTGYVPSVPFYKLIHTVDTRPMQVCISTVQRTLNCKLVEFEPNGLQMFLSMHGRDNYTGGKDGNLNELLKNYAYDDSGVQYPFLKITTQLKNVSQPTSSTGSPTNVEKNGSE